MQKHNWMKLCAAKKTKHQVQFMLTKSMLTNLDAAVSTKAANKNLAACGYNSMSLYILVLLSILSPKAMTTPEAKVAVDKEWENASLARTQSKRQKKE